MKSTNMGQTVGQSSSAGVAGERTGVVGRLRDYELLEPIGQGGMGTVYRARHVFLKREVALKVLPRERTDDEQSVSRFRREMEAVGQLRHPNLVEAHDAGEEHGTHFLVMEYVAGVDASRLQKELGPPPSPQPAKSSARRPSACNTSTSTAWSTATSNHPT